MQNLLLTIQAMGLGGWIHGSPPAPILLGAPEFEKYGPGLGFRFESPRTGLLRKARIPVTPLPAWRANPVGLDGLLEGHCPPYYENMSDAVDAVIADKFDARGIYGDPGVAPARRLDCLDLGDRGVHGPPWPAQTHAREEGPIDGVRYGVRHVV